MPDKYIVNYPAAQQFCPPVESYFDDVTQLIQQIGGRRVRHAPGGGYGLPVVTMVEGPLPETLPMRIDGHDFSITTRDGKRFMPTGILHYVTPPDFPITGYALSTDGWRDPTEFLRLMAAEVAPAPYEPIPKAVAAKPRK
jgi:hypothetical protein